MTAGNKVSPVADMYHDAARLAAWPRKPDGWVFLGTVVDELGKAMFPTWKSYSAYGLLPDVAVGTSYNGVFVEPDEQLRYASWLLKDRREDTDYIYRANNPFAYLYHEENGRDLTEEEWSAACDLSQQEWAIGLGNQRMFREVQAHIVQEAEARRIIIGSRPLRGGEPQPTPRDWWFTDHYEARFRHLMLDPNDPFSDSVPAPEVAHHMFVRGLDMGQLLAVGSNDRSLIQHEFQYSPYLRLMLEVSESLGISPSMQPKKDLVALELQSRWESYGLPASDHLLQAAASLLREPISQFGKAKK